jgi:hypothetical protein
LAGLDPAIYVFLAFGDLGGQDVDARNKSGQGVLIAASWLVPLDPGIVPIAEPDSRGTSPAKTKPGADFPDLRLDHW